MSAGRLLEGLERRTVPEKWWLKGKGSKLRNLEFPLSQEPGSRVSKSGAKGKGGRKGGKGKLLLPCVPPRARTTPPRTGLKYPQFLVKLFEGMDVPRQRIVHLAHRHRQGRTFLFPDHPRYKEGDDRHLDVVCKFINSHLVRVSKKQKKKERRREMRKASSSATSSSSAPGKSLLKAASLEKYNRKQGNRKVLSDLYEAGKYSERRALGKMLARDPKMDLRKAFVEHFETIFGIPADGKRVTWDDSIPGTAEDVFDPKAYRNQLEQDLKSEADQKLEIEEDSENLHKSVTFDISDASDQEEQDKRNARCTVEIVKKLCEIWQRKEYEFFRFRVDEVSYYDFVLPISHCNNYSVVHEDDHGNYHEVSKLVAKSDDESTIDEIESQAPKSFADIARGAASRGDFGIASDVSDSCSEDSASDVSEHISNDKSNIPNKMTPKHIWRAERGALKADRAALAHAYFSAIESVLDTWGQDDQEWEAERCAKNTLNLRKYGEDMGVGRSFDALKAPKEWKIENPDQVLNLPKGMEALRSNVDVMTKVIRERDKIISLVPRFGSVPRRKQTRVVKPFWRQGLDPPPKDESGHEVLGAIEGSGVASDAISITSSDASPIGDCQ